MNPELLARWTKTRSVLQLAGVVGLFITVCTAVIGVRFVILAWVLQIKPAIIGITLFTAALVLTPSIHLLRQSAAIRRATVLRNDAAFAEVLCFQLRYWSFIGVSFVLLLLFAGLVAAVGAIL